MPATACPETVAAAAPASPQPNPRMKSASSAPFKTPAATVTQNPSVAFSAVIIKLWKEYCSIKKGMPHNRTKP